MLCEQTTEERLVVTTVRAKEAVEALLRLLMVKVPAGEFAPAVTAVLNQRLIRKLCESCREAYQPNPEVLKQIARGTAVGDSTGVFEHAEYNHRIEQTDVVHHVRCTDDGRPLS